jgi:hypothetical protein
MDKASLWLGNMETNATGWSVWAATGDGHRAGIRGRPDGDLPNRGPGMEGNLMDPGEPRPRAITEGAAARLVDGRGSATWRFWFSVWTARRIRPNLSCRHPKVLIQLLTSGLTLSCSVPNSCRPEVVVAMRTSGDGWLRNSVGKAAVLCVCVCVCRNRLVGT